MKYIDGKEDKTEIERDERDRDGKDDQNIYKIVNPVMLKPSAKWKIIMIIFINYHILISFVRWFN